MNANSSSRNLALMLVLAGGMVAVLFGRTPFSSATAQDDPAATADAQPVLVADAGNEPTNSPAPTPTTTTAPAPMTTDLKLSPGVQQIVKLAQGGVGDDVELAYIGTVTTKFNLGSDQIIFLNDIGVSSGVIKAMIQRDATLDDMWRAAATANLPPTNAPTAPYPPNTGAYPPAADNTGANPPDMTDYSTPMPGDYAATDDADYFYNSLAPYGSWVYVSGTGLCWQPTVCAGNADWRPYWDRGRWVYTDCGWYWQSDYSWGWGPFHYGRWFQDPKRGWCWQPDHMWGPAWVSWRQSADYCGWAPLPPGVRYVAGVGLQQTGPHPIGTRYEFGLRLTSYNLIPTSRMTDYTPSRYGVSPAKHAEVLSQTRVINNVTVVNNKMVVHGVDPTAVAAASSTAIRHAKIQDAPVANVARGQTDWMTKRGDGLVIYRPQLPQPAPSRPASATGVPKVSVPAPARTPNNGAVKTSEVAPVPATTPKIATASTPVPQRPSFSFVLRGSNIEPAPVEDYPPNSLVILGKKNATQTPTYNTGSLPNMKLQPPAPAPAPRSPADTFYGPVDGAYSIQQENQTAAHSFQFGNNRSLRNDGGLGSPEMPKAVDYFGFARNNSSTANYTGSQSSRPFDDMTHTAAPVNGSSSSAQHSGNNDLMQQVRSSAASHPAPSTYRAEPTPQPVHSEPPHYSPPPPAPAPAPVHVEPSRPSAPAESHSSPPASSSSSSSSSGHK